MPDQAAPIPWVDIDPEAPLLAFFNKAGEKLVEFNTKQDFDDWSNAVRTLTEFRQMLESRLKRLRGLEEKYNPGPQCSPFWWSKQIEEIEFTLGWLDTKRSGHG